MRWEFSVLGYVLRVTLGPDEDEDTGPGDCTTSPVGFPTPTPDVRYERVPGGDIG